MRWSQLKSFVSFTLSSYCPFVAFSSVDLSWDLKPPAIAKMVFFMKSRPGLTRKWCQTAWHHFLSIQSTFGTCAIVIALIKRHIPMIHPRIRILDPSSFLPPQPHQDDMVVRLLCILGVHCTFISFPNWCALITIINYWLLSYCCYQ